MSAFLGVLADGPTNTLWACEIIGVGKDRHSILRSFDLTSATPKLRWPLRIFRLRPGVSEPELLIQDRTLDGC